MRVLMDIAAEAARAGARALDERRGALGRIRTKASPTDFVTDADIASGIAVAQTLAKLDPVASLVVEEPEVCEQTGCRAGSLDDERVWVIDPIDGTTSFMHGFPCYSVSLALLEQGVPVVAATLNAATGELFTAGAAQGAFLDGEPISVSSAEDLERSLVVTGFPYDRGTPLERQLGILGGLLRRGVQGVRRDGSAAVDLTHVASGRADAFYELALQPWDTAAGVLIVREAGGVVTALDGSPWRPTRDFDILAAGPRLHERLLGWIAELDVHRPR